MNIQTGLKVFIFLLGSFLVIWALSNSMDIIKLNIKRSYSQASQGLYSVSKRLQEYVGPKSLIFTNHTRWGLGYYLLGFSPRTEGYEIGARLKYMKSLLKSEPYTKSYILFYRFFKIGVIC